MKNDALGAYQRLKDWQQLRGKTYQVDLDNTLVLSVRDVFHLSDIINRLMALATDKKAETTYYACTRASWEYVGEEIDTLFWNADFKVVFQESCTLALTIEATVYVVHAGSGEVMMAIYREPGADHLSYFPGELS